MKPQEFRQACKNCSLSSLCLPVGLDSAEMKRLDKIIHKQKVVQKGELLVREDQEFSGLFAVHSGSLKAYQSTPLGRDKIIGFYLPGELFGFDAIYPQKYTLTLQALELSSVCELPFAKLLGLASELPPLQSQLFSLMSQQINVDYVVNRQASAEQNIAAFLLNLSQRYQRRGLSATKFVLSMPRQDIANYLGLATETISRILTRFQENNLIHVERRQIELLDLRQLQILTCGE